MRSSVSGRFQLFLVSCLSLGAAAPVAADQDWTGPLGREATVYGQVSASVVTASDGTDRRTYGADAAQSVSRIGFRASMPGSVRNFRFETGLGFRHSNQVGQMAEAPAFDLTKSDIRWLQLSWALPRGQTFSLGQGSMATDNVATSDLSGTDVVTGVSVPDMAGRFQFRTRSGLLSGPAMTGASAGGLSFPLPRGRATCRTFSPTRSMTSR